MKPKEQFKLALKFWPLFLSLGLTVVGLFATLQVIAPTLTNFSGYLQRDAPMLAVAVLFGSVIIYVFKNL